jgi:hypothetical protein
MLDDKTVRDLGAALADRAIESFANAVWSGVTAVSRQMRFALKTGFAKYVQTAVSRYSVCKTLLYREVPQFLYSFYVPLSISNSANVIPDAHFTPVSRFGNFHIISGTGGSGKSMLMRHLFITAAESTDRLPIFLELRSLNGTDAAITPALQRLMAENGLDLDANMLERAFVSGRVILFLDGFDEVDQESRGVVRNQILALAERFPNSTFLVSSRPDDEFVSWSKFIQWTPKPLSKAQAVSLIGHLEYDKEVKKRFAKDVDQRLYEQQPSFVSNPLLLTIMLLSYSANADVPSKRHLFYAQAFEALWNRHDATKGSYRRERRTSLAMDDFIAILSAFSIQTYLQERTQFAKEQIVGSLASSAKAVAIDVNEEDYLCDLISALCFIVQDGQVLSFAHRSFQEYYAAVFLTRCLKEVRADLWDAIVRRCRRDSVLSLLHEMNADLLEDEVLVPRLRALRDRLTPVPKNDEDLVIKYASLATDEMMVDRDNRARFALSDVGDLAISLVDFVVETYSPDLNVVAAKRPPSGKGPDRQVIKAKDFEAQRAMVLPHLMGVSHFSVRCRAALRTLDRLEKRASQRREHLKALIAPR